MEIRLNSLGHVEGDDLYIQSPDDIAMIHIPAELVEDFNNGWPIFVNFLFEL